MGTTKSSKTQTKENSRRAKPLVQKASYTPTRRRYPNGGKVK